jgi:glycosyltransferase involved in cell wall biosynthesis
MKSVLLLVNHEVVAYNFRLEIIEKLLLEGYKVILSCPNGEKINDLIKIGVIHESIAFNRRSFSIIQLIKVYLKYIKLLKKYKPKVVLTFTVIPNLIGGLASLYLKVNYIINITGLGLLDRSRNLILVKILKIIHIYIMKKSLIVFFQNKSNLNYFSSDYNKPENYKLLPGSGVNVKNFPYQNYPKPSSKIKVYFFGRITKDKGIDLFLEVAKRFKKFKSKVEFIVVGEIEKHYNGPLLELHKKNIIKYKGYLKDIRKDIKECWIVINPSYSEGMSNVNLELASSGRPVITANIPGCKETIIDNVTGFLFNFHSETEITSKLTFFLNLKYSDRVVLGKNARKFVVKNFNRQIVVENYFDIIKML